MCCFKFFIAGQTIKTAAALPAVVFLLCSAGCSSVDKDCCSEKRSHIQQAEKSRRPARRRAADYSHIPGNYPANWQRATIGN